MSRKNLFWAVLCVATCCGASVAQAQFFFESDAVFLQRNNSGSAPFIAGPGGVSSGKGSYGVEPGYRLGFGWMGNDVQVDATFTQISPWTADSNGSVTGNMYFDQGPGGAATDNSLVFPGFLREAANSSLAGLDESNEREFLTPGSAFTTSARSNYRDLEINVGTSQYKRPWRLAVGYRNISLDEKSMMRVSGVFDADGAGNDGLSDAALINAGATHISGGSDGFFVSTPDTIATYQVNGNAANDLSGAQLLFGYRIFDNSWFSLEGISKAGVYRNSVSGQVQETLAGSGYDNSVYQRTLTSHDTSAAFAGNLGLRAVFSVTDYIDVLVGYEVLFLSGVGLGPDQANGIGTNAAGVTTYHVKHDGSLIANGGTIGLRIYW